MTQPDTVEVSQYAGKPIDEDVPCLGCGYDLRGLWPHARCPECGINIRRSVVEYDGRRRDFGPPLSAGGREWLLHVIEGAALVQVVLLLMLSITFAPDWAWTLRTRPREMLLGIACTIIVLACLGAWKIGRPEPNGTDRRRSLWLRGCTAVYLGLPLTAGLMPRYDAPAFWIALALGTYAAGLVACVLYYRVIASLGFRAGSSSFPVHANLLAALSAFVMLGTLLPELDGPEDSLSQTLEMPTMQIGSAEGIRRSVRLFGLHPVQLLGAVFPLWSSATNAWLLMLLIRARARRERASDLVALPGHSGTTAPNSRP